MQVSSEVHKFTSACEHLLASVATHRPLTEDEKRLIEYYCTEVCTKLVSPPSEPSTS
jgi:hypothetical protein